jgi:hypothetical protein
VPCAARRGGGDDAPACRQWACEFIAERALGKPQYEIDLPPEAPKTSWDFSKLTLEELEIFEPLLDKVRRLNTGEPGEPLSSLPPLQLVTTRPNAPVDKGAPEPRAGPCAVRDGVKVPEL